MDAEITPVLVALGIRWRLTDTGLWWVRILPEAIQETHLGDANRPNIPDETNWAGKDTANDSIENRPPTRGLLAIPQFRMKPDQSANHLLGQTIVP